MAPAPFQPIPDSTQVHVDRLIGATIDGFEIIAKASEGRFGTLYRARRASGQDVTLEVLRTELTGDDEEVKAGNAIKCAGIAVVTDFGQVPDGRHYRVMELLAGESLAQVLERRGRLPPAEAVRTLALIAEVLEAAHSWAVPHGNLGASSVLLVDGAVKLIDFGLAKRRAGLVEDDLQQLGALGFLLLTGEERDDLPPRSATIPAPLDALLRDLCEQRVKKATAARKELARVVTLLAPAAPSRRAGVFVGVLTALVAAGVTLFVLWPREPELDASDPFDGPPETLEQEPEEEAEPAPSATEPAPTTPRPTTTPIVRRPRAVPSDRELLEQISRLEARFRQQARPGDDVDQALFVLNKQRLRLSGAPTEQDRRDVAQQLAGWKRSYLRR